MAPPSALVIATRAVERLRKEEKSYDKELKDQRARIDKLEADIKNKASGLDENAEFILKQEYKALNETEKVLDPLKERFDKALQTLQDLVKEEEVNEKEAKDVGLEADPARAELDKAKEVLKEATGSVPAEGQSS